MRHNRADGFEMRRPVLPGGIPPGRSDGATSFAGGPIQIKSSAGDRTRALAEISRLREVVTG
jgi:hypothetical protein